MSIFKNICSIKYCLCFKYLFFLFNIVFKFCWNKSLTQSTQKLPSSNISTFGLMLGTRMLLIPPSFTLILRQRLERVCGEVLFTFLACTHCVAIPSTVSPTRFTSAKKHQQSLNVISHLHHLFT